MTSSLSEALNKLRLDSISEFEKGKYFEQLVKVYLENDDAERQNFDKVWHYSDWAAETDKNKSDVGIDLVARLSDGSGLCAIQCKFYAPDHRIQKPDIDSFISAAATSDFQSLLLIDTTTVDLGLNAKRVLENLEKTNRRIALTDLEQSRLDWASYIRDGSVAFHEKKSLRQHQKEALDAVKEGLSQDDRGKLIMACGTGKTFTGLKIAEELGGAGKVVLFMVPSLALMSQTVREWKNDCGEEFLAFSVCSDVKVGKREASDDAIQLTVHDLAFPATTNAAKIAEQVNTSDRSKMVVVFSTYQSIQAISDAQQKHDLPDFDLIICDEAHRTTGATIAGEDDSNFVRIHSDEHVVGKKRLYMTATPKIYGENAKSKAEAHDAAVVSMDEEEQFGKTLFYRGFSWAVENNLLSDYKVIVLAVDEGIVSSSIQNRLREDNEMKLDDATKIIGCYKALTKQNLIGETSDNPKPMKRALAFCKNIAISKMITDEFAEIIEEYDLNDPFKSGDGPLLDVQTNHVDGTFNAKQREERLTWLKAETEDNTCRILTNARCLSEGVDVPALDAIMFLHPRKSQIDVVQSVGRVMRRAEGKDMGYVILPVAVPAGVAPEEALNDNERYKVVWQILNALRAHDERFDATINQAGLGEDISGKIEIVGITNPELEAITAVVDDIDLNKTKAKSRTDIGGDGGREGDGDVVTGPEPSQMGFVFDELTQAIRAKIVEKCGTREYWDTWAKDIAKIAETHITRIKSIIEKEGEERKAFQAFLDEIRDDLNPEVSENDAVEMLAQHLITKPVFDTLFKDNEFTKNNPVSRAMEVVLEQLHHHNIGKEADSLQKFYASVQRRADAIKSAQGRQTLVVELYDKFFRTAFPAMTQKLGIVYTPVEVVDFIIHSVNDVLQSEFGQTLGSKGVHILDPFTGTGTFITRLLQSGLIKPEELEHKYKHEIHANEIVLLAYYIAAINIEAVYHDMAKENAIANGKSGEDMPYAPFDGMVLTDTFQLYEQDKDMIADLLPDNSERRTAQKKEDIRVIVGNPPYSAGQKSENDDAQKVSYPNLDASIARTYVQESKANLHKALYDSYVRAIRWASERIQAGDNDRGVVAYVSNASWIDGNSTDGLRKCLAEEFSSIYVFHLRGNQRTVGEQSRREGGKIFGSGSRAPIAITVLVRNPEVAQNGRISFHDIGDYLDQKEKLAIVRKFKSIQGIADVNGWRKIEADANNDWLNQSDRSFDRYIPLGAKRDQSFDPVFANYSQGLLTSRDAWCINASATVVATNMKRMVSFYQSERQRYANAGGRENISDLSNFVSNDTKKISWSGNLKDKLSKQVEVTFVPDAILEVHYRPFSKQAGYFSRDLNERVYQLPKLFPEVGIKSLIIKVSGTSAAYFSTLLIDAIPSYDLLTKGQCFPLKLYEPASADDGLFATGETGYTERDGISDAGLKHFQDAYASEQISKEDLFYYIYGLLHSPDYRERFKNNLSKELPRIPAVKKVDDFWAFSKAGRELGDLHVNYETVDPYPVVIAEGDLRLADIADPKAFYRVEKMKFGGKGRNKDKSIVHYNPRITMTDIPLRAYEYVVNGKPALDWVMERQCVKTDKASGIINDANDYANETVGNPAYPLELFQRVITVSLKTLDIVDSLPALDID